MIYKTYGKTGLQVSAVGFGGMRFDMKRGLEDNADLVRYAYDQGINYFDTGWAYCEEKSEKIVGMGLKGLPRESFFISTKGQPRRFNTKQKAIDHVKKCCDELQVDYIDFYHLWCLMNMETYRYAFEPERMYEGLLECKAQGLIRHIACSTHQTGSEIRQIAEDGKMEGVLLGLNVLNFPYRWDGVLACNEQNLGVVVMNPLAGGMIPTHEKELQFLARDGETPTEAALRFAVCSPQITVALNGMSEKAHVDMAVKVANQARMMTDEELADTRKFLGENLNAVCTGCAYCDSCPQNIPIPNYMQVYNEHQMFGKPVSEMPDHIGFERFISRLGDRTKADANACSACGRCEKLCTQKLPIIQRMKQMAEWEEIHLKKQEEKKAKG